MDNRELEKMNTSPEAEQNEALNDTPAEETAPEVTEQVEQPTENEASEKAENAKKEKKPKKEKKAKADEPSKGPKKAIIICSIIAAIIIVLGVAAAGVLWYLGTSPDSDVLPPEQSEEQPELEDGTKFY